MSTRKPRRVDQYRVLISPSSQRTWCSVVRVTFQRDATLVARLGHVPLDVPQSALEGLSDVEAVQVLVWLLGQTLGLPTAAQRPSAPPLGATGGRGWSQPTLNLDLRS